MSYTLSPQMNLPIPGVGTEAGPQYAFDINNALTIVDGHTHTPGSGALITSEAISINAALTFANNAATNVSYIGLVPQTVLPTVNALYEFGADLYYVDAVGNAVRITANGGVAGTPGSIAGLAAPASATYVSGSQTFVWQSDTSVSANLDAASLLMRNISPNSTYALTLQPPASLAANYSVTLPLTPATASVVTMDTSGVMGTQDANFLLPTGAVLPYMGTSAPSGFLLCNGTAVSRTTYAALFALIGITNGQGNGTTTFNLPDMRGMFLRGVDGGRGLDPNAGSRTAAATGGNTGDNVGSSQSDEFESHTHVQNAHNHMGAAADTGAGVMSSQGAGAASGARLTTDTTATNQNTGGSETRPVNLYVNYIIKT